MEQAIEVAIRGWGSPPDFDLENKLVKVTLVR
jgi:hypothetical protein